MDKLINQSDLANDISSKISESFIADFLVKPMDPIKVKKEFAKLPANKQSVKDENGINAIDVDGEETEIKEVDSDYRKGIVIKRPLTWDNSIDIQIGDIIVFRSLGMKYYDLIKDSCLVRYYDIVAVEKNV